MNPWPLTEVLRHRDGHGSPIPRLLTPSALGSPLTVFSSSSCRGADHLAPTSTLPGSCSLACPDSNLCPQQRHLGLGVTGLGGGQNIWAGQAQWAALW